MQAQDKSERRWLLALLIAYVVCLAYITLFSRCRSLYREVSFNPINPYRQWIAGDRAKGKALLLNITLFIPLGYLVYAFVSAVRRKPFFLACSIGFCAALLVEIVQHYSGRGMADASDLLNNTLGACLGAAGCFVIRKTKSRPLTRAMPLLLALAGITGCVQMRNMIGTEMLDVDSFYFNIDTLETSNGLSFSGRCMTYRIPTPDYMIYLKTGSGLKTRIYKAQTLTDGESFTAYADVPVAGRYELLVKFRGFVRVSAATYIKDGHVSFTEAPEPPLNPLIEGALLKAYSADWDTYVFEKDGNLIWLIGYGIDEKTEIIFQVQTDETEKLPEGRKQYGFDNLGFRSPKNEIGMIEHYKVFSAKLPEAYHITSVTVGLNPGGKVVWRYRFRVETEEQRKI